MLVPLGARPRLSDRLPWATAMLAVLLLLGYLAGSGLGGWFDDLADQARTWGYAPRTPRAVALATHLFVHGSSLHLVGNMLLLLAFAPNVERRLGRPAFLAAFLACGAAGALVFAAAAPDEPWPLVGASAAALGIGALHAVLLRGQRVLVVVWVLVVWVGEIPARLFLALLVGLDLLALATTGFGGGRVALPAHLGGLAAGALLGLVLSPPRSSLGGPAR